MAAGLHGSHVWTPFRELLQLSQIRTAHDCGNRCRCTSVHAAALDSQSIKGMKPRWWERTPAMAAGLTDHVDLS